MEVFGKFSVFKILNTHSFNKIYDSYSFSGNTISLNKMPVKMEEDYFGSVSEPLVSDDVWKKFHWDLPEYTGKQTFLVIPLYYCSYTYTVAINCFVFIL